MLKLFNVSSSVVLDEGEKVLAPAPVFRRQRTVSIITFISVQIFCSTTLLAGLASGLFYYLALTSNNKSADHRMAAIRNSTARQQSYTFEGVAGHILAFLDQPVLTLKSSADLFSAGFIDLSDWSQLHRWLLPQILAYPRVSSLYYVEYPSSDTFGIDSYKVGNSVMYNLQLTNSKADRLCPAALAVNGFCLTTNGNKTTYSVTKDDVIDLSSASTWISSPMFGPPDPTELGRYARDQAVRNEVSWFPSLKVTDAEKGIMGLYFVYPLWTADGTFLGTFAGELSVSNTNELLDDLQKEATANTIIYIFQRDEVMVATSTEDSIVKYDPEYGTPSVVTLSEMSNPFINLTQAHIRAEYGGNFASVSFNTSLNSKLHDANTGIDYIVQFSALSAGNNLDWLVVVGAPEDDYTAAMLAVQSTILDRFQESNRNVVIVIFAFQIGLILLAMATFWFIVVRPLRSLVTGMQKAQEFDFTALSDGKLASNPSYMSEVYQCEQAFFDMTTKFAKAFRAVRPGAQRQGGTGTGTGTGTGSSSVHIVNNKTSVGDGLAQRVPPLGQTSLQLPQLGQTTQQLPLIAVVPPLSM